MSSSIIGAIVAVLIVLFAGVPVIYFKLCKSTKASKGSRQSASISPDKNAVAEEMLKGMSESYGENTA